MSRRSRIIVLALSATVLTATALVAGPAQAAECAGTLADFVGPLGIASYEGNVGQNGLEEETTVSFLGDTVEQVGPESVDVINLQTSFTFSPTGLNGANLAWAVPNDKRERRAHHRHGHPE
jgi:hypothetical protein